MAFKEHPMRLEKPVLPICILYVFAVCHFLAGCRMEPTQENPAVKARAIHDRVLTVDTHCDTASRLPGGSWDIGVRHEPGRRESGKIDLPRMAEGGLDAEFFAVFVGQGERTEQGYARAKEWALKTLEAIHAMCERHSNLVGLALTPDDAYRLERQGRRAAFIGLGERLSGGEDSFEHRGIL
jgi:membrane dipeptidase